MHARTWNAASCSHTGSADAGCGYPVSLRFSFFSLPALLMAAYSPTTQPCRPDALALPMIRCVL
jgi:hypothetical protein